ncbi:UNVERIFIED_CONTAM: hypothetical protein Scaly_1007600 [Sesamum calycinum]|uniref:Rhamnogalacturonan endolyase n=1 Tax=Sesamum calycinum TaxID=2727403 RepID=A0AAW2QIY7_9LAMI
MSDERQRFMPMPKDRLTGETLHYKEAVLLTNPTNPEFKGEGALLNKILHPMLVHMFFLFISKQPVPGASAFVGLASLGDAGSWQLESKDYQFWTQTDQNGNFLIRNAIFETYSLFAWVPGTLGDYKYDYDITISQETIVEERNMVFKAPRKGVTLWEIGIPDRSAAKFFIPDPSSEFKRHKYGVEIEKFRQYGLWTRYEDLYPQKDLVFRIGTSASQ